MFTKKFNWFSPWLLASALAHGLLCWLLLLQPIVPLVESSRPSSATIVTVFSISAAPQQTQANQLSKPEVKPNVKPDITPVLQPPLNQQTTQPIPQTAKLPPAAANPARPAAKPRPAYEPSTGSEIVQIEASQHIAAKPRPEVESAVPLATTDVATILNNIALQTAQRQISSDEIRNITSRAQADANPNVLRTQPNNFADHTPSKDVLQTFQDGSQVVRVGKNCVLAALGAELRKDINSIKSAPCNGTETDRINAHFEQVMSSVGRQR